MRVSIGNLLKRVNLFTLSLVLAVSSLSALGPVLLAQKTSAASASAFSNMPAGNVSNVPSLGFAATQTNEIGYEMSLAGSNRVLDDIDIEMSSWACQTGEWQLNNCDTPTGATFSHPVTVSVYEATAGHTLGTLIATETKSITAPFRPSADPTNCTGSNAGKWYDGTTCYNGKAFVANVDFNSNKSLPENIIVTVGYNTSAHGANPLAVSGPYDSLNVGVSYDPASIGAYENTDVMYYSSGVGGSLSADTGWTGSYKPMFSVNTTQLAAPTLLTPGNNTYVNGVSLTNSWSAVAGASTYLYQSYNDAAATSLRFSSTYSTTSKTATNVADAAFWWRVTAIDAYGNVGEASPLWKVTVDHTKPAAPLNGQPTLTGSNDFYFTWDAVTDSGSPVVEYQFQSSGSNTTDGSGSLVGAWQNWVNYVTPEQQTLTTPTIHSTGAPDGTYFWQARAIDAAGNVGAWSTVWTTDIDTTAPAVPSLTFPSDGVYRQTSNSNHSDWSVVTDAHGPVTYIYQSAFDTAFTNIAYNAAETPQTDNFIANPGEPAGTYYWHVKACDALGNCSAWSPYRTINIDNTAPVVNVLDLFTNDSTPVITGTVNDPTANVEVTVNGHTYTATKIGTTWSAQVTNPIADGRYNVVVTATDLAGNIGVDNDAAKELTVDVNVPGKPVFLLPARYTNNPTTAFLWLGLGTHYPLTYNVQVNNVNSFTGTLVRDVTGLTLPFYSTDLADGTYYARANATDELGGTGAWSNIRTVTVDTQDPTAAITTPTGPYVRGNAVHVTGTIGDANLDEYRITIKRNSNNATVYSYTNTASASTFDRTWNTTATADGAYTITLRATDKAGNVTTVTKVVTVDNTAPTQPGTPVTTPNPTMVQGVTWTWTASTDVTSGVANYQYSLDGSSTWVDVATNTVTTTLTEGLHTLVVRTVDNAGNTSVVSNTGNVVVDLTKPTPVLGAQPAVAGGDTDSLTITGEVSDNVAIASYQLTISDGEVNIYNSGIVSATAGPIADYLWDISTLNGSYTITLRATDTAGNTDTTSIPVFVDNEAPTPEITTPTAPDLTFGNNATVVFEGISNDEDAVYSWTVDDGVTPVTPGSSFSWNTTGLASGTYRVTLEATDLLGNFETTFIDVIIDNTAPVITYVDYTQVGNVITPNLTVEGYLNYTWVPAGTNPVGGATFNANTVTPSFTITKDGTYSFTLTANDSFGNSSSYVFTFTYEAPVEATAPTSGDTSEPSTVLGADTDQAVTGATDDKSAANNNGNIFGLAWYWWILIIAALVALAWWLIAALRRRQAED